MTTFVRDTFTDTAGIDLATHTPEVGSTWSNDYGVGHELVITAAGRVRKTTGQDQGKYRQTVTPPSPDYTVEADVCCVSVLASDWIGVFVRLQSGADVGYSLNTDGLTWQVAKQDPGFSVIATLSQTLVAGVSYHIVLSISGTTLTASVDGVAITGIPPVTVITVANFVGTNLGFGGATLLQTDTAGLHLDNFTAYDSPSLGPYRQAVPFTRGAGGGGKL